MGKRKLNTHFLPRAYDDLDEIITFISNENPAAAKRLFDEMERKIMKLEDYPYSGHNPNDIEIKKLGYRQLTIKNYLVFYRIENNSILICRIIHASRNYRKILQN